MRRISTMAVFALLVVASSVAAPPASPFLLRQGTIVDTVRGAAYVAKPNGTIDAVDLAGGRTLWTSADAALPLGLVGDLLVAQFEETPRATGRFRIVLLDAAGGRKVGEAEVTLPAGARALVGAEEDETFRATAEGEGAVILVSWLYQESLVRGIAPLQPGEPTTAWVAGSVRLNAQTAKVLSADGGPVSDVPARWLRYGTPPASPWSAGNVSARAEGGRGGPLTLKRAEGVTGRALPDQALAKQAIASVPSADQRHLLASERVGQGGPDDPEYRWSVFAVDTAERVTELRKDVSAAPFFVFGDSLVVESRAHGSLRGNVWVDEPLEIHAIRLTTGVAKWRVELRDLTDRGPIPPARR